MGTKIDWESQIGRRLRFRDLYVLSIVVQRGSMAKAAAQLGVSQPSVSEVIADLEHALRVRLLDRSPQGIEPTNFLTTFVCCPTQIPTCLGRYCSSRPRIRPTSTSWSWSMDNSG